ncbi:hypothetical protein [Halobacillus naozhouensis]|uniref:Uncharacterized protein n=1 Tax=Halobacillus naozhouensis TaxID=554880 RepID=A0ABY8J088_9BACI|nr:hypothetical protein [Halobacillus naozhouensis]WFT75481.1 hypothetical protein P9989_03525 [Halobacillus naozhouensis]
MGKRITVIAGIVLTCMVAVFLIGSISSNQMVQGEKLEENIKQSMKETKERKEKIEAFRKELHNKFKKKGFQGSISTSIDDLFSSKSPSITISVKDQPYKKEHESEMKQLIKDLVTSYNFGEVAIHIRVEDRGMEELSEEDRERHQLTSDLFEIAHKILKEKGYNKVSTMSLNSRKSKQAMNIEIEGTKHYYNNVKEDIEKIVHDTIYAKKGLNYTVKVTRRSEAEMRDMKWSPIFRAIMEEADKRFEEVTGFAYSFHPEPLQIIIKTSLSDRWYSWGTKEQAAKIEKYVKKIIEIKREELSIKKIPYKVLIRDKKGDKLN